MTAIPSPAIVLDPESLLVDVDAKVTLGELERALDDRGCTLGAPAAAEHPELAIGAWLAEGAPGSFDPWSDPPDHLLAGLTMDLPGGDALDVRAAPRRAVGPDLIALGFGTRGRFGRIVRASLRVHRKGTTRPRTAAFHLERNPPVSDGEERLFTAIARELRASSD